MRIKLIEHFKGIHQGETVFILGNGPSLATHNLSKLAILPTISMNRGYYKFIGNYYVTLMDTFYLKGVMDKPYETVFTVGSPVEIPQDVSWGFESDLVFIARLTKHDKPLDNSFNLSKGWRVTHTGVLALYLAQWMGFANAVLLGYDGTGRHFMPRVQADDVPKHEQHKREMNQFMKQDGRTLEVYNCNPNNTYGHDFLNYKDATDVNF